jgi:hypothetical protein
MCNFCGGTEFDLAPDKKLSTDSPYQLFLFYECPNCAGAGFWTHDERVDETLQIGVALARCPATDAVKPDLDKFWLIGR